MKRILIPTIKYCHRIKYDRSTIAIVRGGDLHVSLNIPNEYGVLNYSALPEKHGETHPTRVEKISSIHTLAMSMFHRHQPSC
jgi:hypothetical protein